VSPANPNDHLALSTGKHLCHCGDKASILMRCHVCKAVIARCGSHGRDIAKERNEHCAKK
jgi:hypothetical protein